MPPAATLRKIPGLNDHELLQMLGEGGMGQVFLARHKRSGETVVVKTVHDHLLVDVKIRQRFQQEIDLMRRFQHPSAVSFIDAAPARAEFPFLIMEYVQGVTLDSLLQKQKRFAPLRAGTFLAPLCLFLKAAHDHCLLHRDLTPANIMVTKPNTPQEAIKVMDFGLARRIGFYIPAGQLEKDGGSIDGGTPDYVCPEQILGRQVDHRGDLFSVGVLLYALLTGHLPHEALTDPMEILGANLQLDPPPFRHWGVVDVPSPLERFVLSCMNKKPSDRPASAQALIEGYQQIIGHRFVDEEAFQESMDLSISTLLEKKMFDQRSVVDRFEACLMEQMAAMKLRGFVNDVGGQVEESDADVIKFRLPRSVESQVKKTLWNMFTRQSKEVEWITLELHMAKKTDGRRDMVDITVVRPLPAGESSDLARIRKLFCDLYCCELRAYLMVGH